jgi:putative endonuclease
VRAFVYILLCSDGSYYTGVTRREVDERVSEHAQGIDPTCYTFSRRPFSIVFSASFERLDEAISLERQIKGWSRVKKQALIRGDYDALPGLAARRRKPLPSPEERSTRARVSPRPEEARSGVSKDGNRRTFAHPSRRALGAPQDEGVNGRRTLKGAAPCARSGSNVTLAPATRAGPAGRTADRSAPSR